MSQDVDDPCRSNRNMPIQSPKKRGDNGQEIVQTPNILNQLGLAKVVKSHKLESKTVNNVGTISPITMECTVKKTVMQTFLKSNHSSEAHIDGSNAVKGIITQKSVGTVPKAVGQGNSSAIQRMKSKTKTATEKSQNIRKHNISNPPGTGQKRPSDAQSKSSSAYNSTSQPIKGKHGRRQSLTTSPPGSSTIRKNKSLSGLETNSNLDQWLNKTPSKSNSSTVINGDHIKKKELVEKSSGIKKTQGALPLEKKISNSSEPSLLSEKPQNIAQHLIVKNNIDKKLSSTVAVRIVRKEKLVQSQPQSNIKEDIKTKQPAPRTARRVSKPKNFDDRIYDVSNQRLLTEDRESEVSSNKKHSEKNVVDVGQVNRSNISSDSQDIATSGNEREKNKKHRRTGVSSKNLAKLDKIDNKNISDDASLICQSQSLTHAKKVISTPTSRSVMMPENNKTKPKKRQSKIINDDSNNSHDKIERENKKNYVPETATITKVPNTIPVLESPTIRKGHGKPRKFLPTDIMTQPNAVIQNPKNESSTLPVTNGTGNDSMTPNVSSTAIVKDLKVTVNKLSDEDLCAAEPEEEQLKSIYHIPKLSNNTVKKRGRPAKYFVINKTPESNLSIKDSQDESLIKQVTNGIDENPMTPNLDRTRNAEELEDTTEESNSNPVKRRGRPSKKRNVDEITESNTLTDNQETESSIIQTTNGINTNSETPELGRSRRAKKVDESQKELSNVESSGEESENGEYEGKRVQRRRRGGGCRGRRRGGRSLCAADADYTPRTAESTRKQKKSEVSEEKTNDIEIVCGKCNEKVAKDKWINHNLHKHNNTGWQEGDPVPDYENNEKLWRSVLSVAHKRKRGSLICDKCSTTKKSVFGFISHYRFCGKTDEERDAMKWICPQCNGVFMPSSQDVHERMHRDMGNQNKVVIVQSTTNGSEVGGSRKRKAAEKAATKISEFTALVKDDEPTAKKSKVTIASIKDLIVRTQKINTIPSVWKGGWAKAIAANEPAECKQPGCNFSTTTLSEICEHYNNCKFKPTSTFTCKICKYISDKMKHMKKHVKEQHATKLKSQDDSDFFASDSNDESEVDEVSTEVQRSRRSIAAPMTPFERAVKYEHRAAFLRNEKYGHENNPKITFLSALHWTLTFELNNYRPLVFEELKPNNSTLLTNKEAENYLPELTVSMRVQQLKSPVINWEERKQEIIGDRWKTLGRFESCVVDGFPTFFVGGPVWSMAWLPIPTALYSENVDQYIAISTHAKMEDKLVAGKSYKFRNIIQIWNLGHLDHSLSHTPKNPQLVYAIAHEKGTIWSMEWCPSGAYENSSTTNINQQTQNSSPRMGLLAVASSDGCVHIYSIAFPEKLNFIKTDESNLPIYKTDPVVTLQFNQLYHEENEINWQCTTLSWSKLDGHDTIAAGFSNGYVALWDLTMKSPLLVTKKDATLFITSYCYFFAHKQTVTGIIIMPFRGRRFLATVGVDRCAKFWDLEDTSACVAFVKKGMSVNCTWMTHWPNIIAAYDDVLGMGHTTTYMIGLREPCSKAFPLLPTNSPSYGLASSDYANGVIHGTSAGELVAIFPFQMLYYRDLEREKLNRKRWLISSVEIIDFEKKEPEIVDEKEEKKKNNTSHLKEYVYMPDTYEKCNERFGLIFHNDVENVKKDMTKKSDRKNPLNSDTMKTAPVEQYNFASINRISWNPNAWSYLWLGVGYQNGFIRILHLKSMSMQDSIMKLLPGHVKKQLNKESGVKHTNTTRDIV